MPSLIVLFSLLVSGVGAHADAACESLLATFDREFVGKNETYESTLWKLYNAHAGVTSQDLEAAEKDALDYLADPANLARVEKELAKPDLSDFERVGLDGYRRLFKGSAVTNPVARAERDELLATESRFREKRGAMKIGYVDPKTKALVEAPPKTLSELIANEPDEAIRKAAFDGLRAHEGQLLAADLIATFKQRNKFARALGYPDYYEYKLREYEGLTKKQVFDILDDLEVRSRPTARAAWDKFAAESGPEALEPWNTRFAMRGDLNQRLAEYFSAPEALLRWGRTFDCLGIDFKGAEVKIDLLHRDKKYNNGFMRVNRPSYVTKDGFVPAIGNFTATALLDRPTAGLDFARTLHHEGAHAAHFANSGMPGASYLTEFPPSSIANAELQALFLDSFLADPHWLGRYAKSEDGRSIPPELVEEMVLDGHRYHALGIRSMMITPFLERALYEEPEESLTPERVLALAREIELRLLFAAADKPALTIIHLQSSESAGYYHAYVLARLAAEQVRERLMARFGFVVDNDRVGRELSKTFWEPGNSIHFLQMVQNFAGEPFSADAMIRKFERTEDDVRRSVAEGLARAAATPNIDRPLRLNLDVTMEDGDAVITSTKDGKSFHTVAHEYADWIRSRTPAPARAKLSRREFIVQRLRTFADDVRRRWAR